MAKTAKSPSETLHLAWTLRGEGKYSESAKLLNELDDTLPDDAYNHLGRLNHIKAQLVRDAGKLKPALDLYTLAHEHYKLAKNADRMAHSLRHVADVSTELGENDKALACYQKSIALYNEQSEYSVGDKQNALKQYAVLLKKLKMDREYHAVQRELAELKGT